MRNEESFAFTSFLPLTQVALELFSSCYLCHVETCHPHQKNARIPVARMSLGGDLSIVTTVCIQHKHSFGGDEGNRTPFHNTFPIKVSGISTHTTINFTDSVLNR